MKENNVVERGVPLSQSFIWNLQAKFYESLGIDAWLSGVIPSKITTNSFIAKTYARMIAAYAQDLGSQQLTIVELGAGHGRFGFLCIQHLTEMAEAGLFPVRDWKFVMTDVAERNIGFWQQHAALRPFVERGVLDFARYQAGVDTTISLRESGVTIGVDAPVENLVVIGNYFFDSLPIDVWQVTDNRLMECRPILSLQAEATCDDKQDAAILEQLELDWECREVASAGYARADWNALIEHFRTSLGDAAFTLPIGAFETLETLSKWSCSGYLLLTADKGYARESDLRGRPLPTMVQHGCFSFSVNFCALEKWFQQQGGQAWLPSYQDGNLEFAAFCKGAANDNWPRLRAAYQDGPAEFSPGDFHQIVRRCEQSKPDFRNCLSLIRLSCHEPQVFYHLRRLIRGQLAKADSADRAALRATLATVAKRYFHLYEQDVLFAVALVYQQLGDYEQAIPLYRQSLALFGEEAATLFNMALCLVELGDLAEARELAARAIELDSEYAEVAESVVGLCDASQAMSAAQG